MILKRMLEMRERAVSDRKLKHSISVKYIESEMPIFMDFTNKNEISK